MRESVVALAVDNIDRVYAAISATNASGNRIPYVVRLRGNGTIDTAFGTNGYAYVRNNLNNDVDISDMDFDVVNGGLYLCGNDEDGMWVKRLTNLGFQDNGFGGGIKRPSFDGVTDGEALRVVVDPRGNGKVVVAGVSYTATHMAMGAIRYTSTGVADGGFGGGDGITIAFPRVARVLDATVDSSGRVLLVGFQVNTAGNGIEAAIARRLENGAPDPSFYDSTGRRTYAFYNASGGVLTAVALSTAGITTAGTCWSGASPNRLCFVRFSNTGTPTSNFGEKQFSTGTMQAAPNAIVMDGDKPIVAGSLVVPQ